MLTTISESFPRTRSKGVVIISCPPVRSARYREPMDTTETPPYTPMPTAPYFFRNVLTAAMTCGKSHEPCRRRSVRRGAFWSFSSRSTCVLPMLHLWWRSKDQLINELISIDWFDYLIFIAELVILINDRRSSLETKLDHNDDVSKEIIIFWESQSCPRKDCYELVLRIGSSMFERILRASTQSSHTFFGAQLSPTKELENLPRQNTTTSKEKKRQPQQPRSQKLFCGLSVSQFILKPWRPK